MSDETRRGLSDGIDPARVRTVPLSHRTNKVSARDFAQPPGDRRDFGAFLDSLPDILEARSLLAVIDALVAARRSGAAVVFMLGGHVVKTGLAPVLIELVRRGVITHLASNGSAVIHDYEVTRWGGTSEDVEAGLRDGTFGMAEETGREMNEAITRGHAQGLGLGESLAVALESAGSLANPELSLLLAARRHGIHFTVHAALGAEIIHQHPAADGAAIGATSMTDFRRLAGHLPRLEGGVVLNIGSSVIMPEVFLKALTVSRNVHAGAPRAFVAADLDMTRHYRPRVNVVERPTRTGGGKGYQITGHHEIMVPLLAWGVIERLEAGDA
ncbi:MAG TPA: hypothetical protein VK929_00785 [Longimicrobiales bacterium]|nr:hypothetical protein [Longimicrobiales bacterium]